MLLTLTALSAIALLDVQLHPSGLLELRLAREAKLNALNPELISLLNEQASRATEDAEVKGVLLTANPRAKGAPAFCAGGDIKGVSELPLADGKQFLNDEYTLMLRLHELNRIKPVIALANGLAFGAGAGLFMSAGTRIATDVSSLAMPECVLGIIPDCGGTEFLMGLPCGEPLGRSFALSGGRIPHTMMIASGLATHTCKADDADTLRESLLSASDVSAALKDAEAAAKDVADAHSDGLASLSDAASRVFGSSSIPLESLDVSAKLQEAAKSGDGLVEGWAKECLAKFDRGCPAALIVAYEASRLALPKEPYARRAQSIGIELVANQALAGRPDFLEGVACAVGAKKGEAPQWQHASVQEAADDPEVMEIVERVRTAKAMEL